MENGSSGWKSGRDEEFQEEDVWGSVYEEIRYDDQSDSPNKTPSLTSKRLPSAAARRMRKPAGMVPHHSSAPVNVPDWSKIYGKSSGLGRKPFKNAFLWQDTDSDGDGTNDPGWETNYEDDDEEDDEGNVIPPHDWIAKKLAMNKISSFSVCEGAGRTLKGRDLSRVRNAVLTKTGFLESKSDYLQP